MTNLKWSALSLALILSAVVHSADAKVTTFEISVKNSTDKPLSFQRYVWKWPGANAPEYAGWVKDDAAKPIVIEPGISKMVEWVIGAGFLRPGAWSLLTVISDKSQIRGGVLTFDGVDSNDPNYLPIQIFGEFIPQAARDNIMGARIDAAAGVISPSGIGHKLLGKGGDQVTGGTVLDTKNWSVANALWTSKVVFPAGPMFEVEARGIVTFGQLYPDVEFTVRPITPKEDAVPDLFKDSDSSKKEINTKF